MDKKQIHKIGKNMNKPIKVIKNHAGVIVSVVVPLVATVVLGKKSKKQETIDCSSDVSRRGESVSDGNLETLGSRFSHEIPKEAADVLRPT